MFPGLSSAWNASQQRQYYVYVLSNSSMTLYIGVTNDLPRRLFEHRNGAAQFTSRYHFGRLVYFELFGDALDAIEREKQLKGWTRAKKIALVKTLNPSWRDLSAEFGIGES